MPKLFLTGGSGMVGRNILDQAGLNEFDVLAPSSKDVDLTQSGRVYEYIQDHKPDIIVHVAGRVGGIQANMAHPIAFLDDNLMMGRNVIMGAYQSGVPKLINLASTCVYPRNAPNPLSEEFVLQGELEPTNEGYAIAKIAALRMCEYVVRENPALQYKTLLPCNLFGKYDKFSPEHSHLVPAIIHKVHEAKLAGEETVEIWGDGSARREFMLASDLANVVVRAMNSVEALPDLMNVGLGHDYSVNEYYQYVADVVGWSGTFTHNLSKPVGMKQKLCSTQRMRAWQNVHSTSLRDGLEITYHHYLEHRNSQS